jgi:CSLREA domain-containing protein
MHRQFGPTQGSFGPVIAAAHSEYVSGGPFQRACEELQEAGEDPAPGEDVMWTWPACLKAVLAAFAACAVLLASSASAVNGPYTFTVDSTMDGPDANPGDGECSMSLPPMTPICTLRAAIQEANAQPGHDTIVFSIGEGVHTIAPTAAVPSITDAVTIDGTTQPGCATYPCIELSGTNAGNGVHGLWVAAGGSTVRGLVINSFGGSTFAVSIALEADGNTIEDNHIGTDVAGVTGLNASARGISIGSNNNIIRSNLISGSSERGLLITGDGNQVFWNLIGTNVAGTGPVPNNEGVEIQNGSGNHIGQNIISGNTQAGVDIAAGANLAANNNEVLGNYIGVNEAGTAAVPNGAGVIIEDYFEGTATGNIIGGLGSIGAQRHIRQYRARDHDHRSRRHRQHRPGQPYRHQRRRHSGIANYTGVLIQNSSGNTIEAQPPAPERHLREHPVGDRHCRRRGPGRKRQQRAGKLHRTERRRHRLHPQRLRRHHRGCWRRDRKWQRHRRLAPRA